MISTRTRTPVLAEADLDRLTAAMALLGAHDTHSALAGAVPNPLMSAAGMVNTLGSASQGDPTFIVDAIAAGASLLPGPSILGGAWTGSKIGSRAGAMLCGYRP